MNPAKPALPFRTILLYLVFGSVWILIPDQWLSNLIFHDSRPALFQTFKSWGFIVLSSALLYSVLRKDYAERQQTVKALRESEQRFRLMFEANPTVMMLIEPASGAIRDANRSAEVFYGYPLTALRRMNINDINQLSPDEVKAERMRALHEERNFFNFPHRLANGELRFVEVYSAPIELGQETLLFSIIHDATERTKAQQQLRNIQHRMRGIIASAMDAILSIDSDQRIVLSNAAAEKMFGYGKGQLIGRSLEVLLPERWRRVHREHIQRFGAGGITTRSMDALGVVYGLRADGSEFPAEASISQILNGPEKIYTVILRDITERKQADARNQRQIQRLRALRAIDVAISSSFDMQVSLDVLLRETRAQLGVDAAAILLLQSETLTLEYAAGDGFRSDAIQQTHLHLREDMAGQVAREQQAVHKDGLSQSDSTFARREVIEAEGFQTYYANPLIAKGNLKGILEIYHRSALQIDPDWLVFVETLAGQAALAVENAQLFENLRRSNIKLERRVLERTAELNRTNAELERANRAKDEFLATMSHELRTPLTSILGLSESLLEQRRGSLNKHQQNSLHAIATSGHHILDLIDDILDMSKIESGEFKLNLEPVSVDEFCGSCLAFVKSLALRKSIALAYTNASNIDRVMADPRRLKQILVSLLTNAVKFTPDHGQVLLEVREDREQELIQFSVIDTGIGIAADDLQSLFQPFVQLDNSLSRQYPGSGLALALVQKLTDLHGGSVKVDSEVGKGSQFTINLASEPETGISAVRATAMESMDGREVSTAVPGSRGTILLAEDNISNMVSICDYLETQGYNLLVAHDGMEAIVKAEHSQPALILMDIQIPVMNGMEVISRLRTDPRFRSTPIIALTALILPGDRERCLAAGATEYLSKPVSVKKLGQTIQRCLDQPNE